MGKKVTEQDVLEDFKLDERQRVEFKRGFIKTGDLAEIIMAFANAEGGTIYLGVDEGSPPQPSDRIQKVAKQDYDNIQRATRRCVGATGQRRNVSRGGGRGATGLGGYRARGGDHSPTPEW